MACAAKQTIPLTSSDQSITPYLSIAPLRQHHYLSHCHQRRLFASRLSLSLLCSYHLIVSSRCIGSPLLRQAITCEQISQGVTLLLRQISGNSIADQAVALKAYFQTGESLVIGKLVPLLKGPPLHTPASHSASTTGHGQPKGANAWIIKGYVNHYITLYYYYHCFSLNLSFSGLPNAKPSCRDSLLPVVEKRTIWQVRNVPPNPKASLQHHSKRLACISPLYVINSILFQA